jgi:hypothetical protein
MKRRLLLFGLVLLVMLLLHSFARGMHQAPTTAPSAQEQGGVGWDLRSEGAHLSLEQSLVGIMLGSVVAGLFAGAVRKRSSQSLSAPVKFLSIN